MMLGLFNLDLGKCDDFLGDSSNSAPGSNPLLGNFLALAGSWCFSAI